MKGHERVMGRIPADRSRGLVLIIVLWTVAILLILAATIRQTSRLDTKMSVFTAQELRCQWAARAGVEKAIAVLNEDDRTTDSLADLWSDNEEDLVNVPLQGCHYTVTAKDESGKLNVNTATRGQLLGLQDWGMEPAIADAIIDWRDTDDTPGEEGVEAGYYENLTYPYTIRNGPFKTLRELLKVRGVTEDLLYGSSTSGASTASAASATGVQNPGWIKFLTCYASSGPDPTGTTLVNINQGDAQSLQQQLGISEGQAQWIVSNRPNNGYTSIGDLISSGSPQTASQASPGGGRNNEGQPLDLQTYRQIVDLITVGSPQTASTSTGPGSGSGAAVGAPSGSMTATTAAAVSASKVNVNTAPMEVLVALWGGTDQAYELANNCLAYRENTLLGMQSIGELLDVPSMTLDAFKGVVDLVTIRSSVFSILSVAKADQTGISGASRVVEAVVDRGQDPPTFLYWYQGVTP